MDSILNLNIFNKKCFSKNINSKFSKISNYNHNYQILAVCTEENDILISFSKDNKNENSLKIISWFRKTSRQIQDFSFDPNGTWLVVLCSENTIHIVPILKILDKIAIIYDNNNQFYSNTYITSYIIPFIGPHECECVQRCPNNSFNNNNFINNNTKENCSNVFNQDSSDNLIKKSQNTFSCPIPNSITWWQTIDKRNRAIIGYTDGSICCVALSPNCPFIASTQIKNQSIEKLIIFRNNLSNVTLLINCSNGEQYKLLLELKCINYVYPGDISPTKSENSKENSLENWQFVLPIKNDQQSDEKCFDNNSDTKKDSTHASSNESSPKSIKQGDKGVIDTCSSSSNKLIPSTKARLSSLKILGAIKLNAIKMKLAERGQKNGEEGSEDDFTVIGPPNTQPELIESNIFELQNLKNTYLLSSMQSNNLRVHGLDANFMPLFEYKIPKNCNNVLISSNLIYLLSYDDNKNNENGENCTKSEKKSTILHVISSALATVKSGEEKDFNEKSLLASFVFTDEIILNIFHKHKFSRQCDNFPGNANNSDSCDKNLASNENNGNQIFFYNDFNNERSPKDDKEIESLKNRFPKINFDPCYVVTNKNIYYIDLSKNPFEIFNDAALAGSWYYCEEFCNIFDLSFVNCVELAGDYQLKKKKVTQALYTYNIARIPPIKTALKLAIHRETYALMHLCAMALKITYILKCRYLGNRITKSLLDDISNMHAEDVSNILPKRSQCDKIVNEGESCSDFKYSTEENMSSLQMSAYSQFHLSNLLIITLAEKAVKDKNYIPLWNYIVTNTKFHTNMTSIVLAQSGLYSSVLLLAMARGCCLDVFLSLISVINQEFGFYSELNVCLYSLTDSIFTECILYLQSKSMEYFNAIQRNLPRLLCVVLNRLEKQLNPFSSVFRPVLRYPLVECITGNTTDDNNLQKFAKCLIETYISVIIQIQKCKFRQDHFINAFKCFKICYEDNQFTMDTYNAQCSLSVGYTNATWCCNGAAYFWGSHANLTYSASKPSEITEPNYVVKPLEVFENLVHVHAVKCGRQHSLILTNNGIYAIGSNQLGQLGINKNILAATQPMLIEKLNAKNIKIMECGQYHNIVLDSDGNLYSWGWGIYGQLGNGDIENQNSPKIIEFFRSKKVISVALGHAHSLILCFDRNAGHNILYVFGSNHYGQLGLGISEINKLLVPRKISFDENIIMINTKFFSNLVVTDKNELYTWGCSPQALRLANQLKRRTNAKQKIEENLKKEIQKRMQVAPDSNGKSSNVDSCAANSVLEECDVKPKKVKDKSESDNHVSLPIIEITLAENNNDIKLNEKPDNSGESTSSEATKAITETSNELTDNHLTPHKIDTTNISGNILQVSTGLFHYALITSTQVLYTWGKNLEHQLGSQDKERKTVVKPSPVDCIENPLQVECGADFTLVLTTDYIVKAFGGNSNGQCGRDLNSTNDSKPGRLFCLPTTKRLVRLDMHCVEIPYEINLPRPYNYFEKPVRYLKTVPKFNHSFLLTELMSPDLDDVINMQREFQQSFTNLKINSDDDISNYSNILDSLSSNNNLIEENGYDFTKIQCLNNYYVHYCLYIFHGLYNPQKIIKLSEEYLEYQIRILLLNLKYYEAFSLSLNGCLTAQKSLHIFEYFTKDTSILPTKRSDLKFFICRLFNHFILKKMNLLECEDFFLSDLEYYLNELSIVLYCNNFGKMKLETELNIRYKNIFNLTNLNSSDMSLKLENADQIFEQLSMKFKTIVCQHIIKNSEI